MFTPLWDTIGKDNDINTYIPPVWRYGKRTYFYRMKLQWHLQFTFVNLNKESSVSYIILGTCKWNYNLKIHNIYKRYIKLISNRCNNIRDVPKLFFNKNSRLTSISLLSIVKCVEFKVPFFTNTKYWVYYCKRMKMSDYVENRVRQINIFVLLNIQIVLQ